ncbi:helix-turn-helix transcriptional regulator [Emcibacter sp. SYSU 3D8]|uniref:helix-turn-helix domain-containing protein n=1 Tax=Emcibacter sp. SYSU 3D8 TaxID=3133969 RepID=UPI0031FF1F10
MTRTVLDQLSGFAERLRLVREACGYASRRAFAQALGIEEAAYRKYERAESYPQPETLGRIRQLTGATVDYLYFGEQAGLPLGLHQRILEISG